MLCRPLMAKKVEDWAGGFGADGSTVPTCPDLWGFFLSLARHYNFYSRLHVRLAFLNYGYYGTLSMVG